jgi:hypothetical protein
MATTTNYGWDTPDDTDLVKDGASAIRTLGSSIDTTTKNLNPQTTTGALAYRSATANVNTALPIGTAGQILAVSGGVPAWINNDQGDITEVQAGVGISVASGTGPIPIITNSSTDLITTAGDLLYGTAADTVARLGIGTANQVLRVNSGATAPEWATASSGALTKITSATFSSVASVSFPANTFTTTYDDYQIIFIITNITQNTTIKGRFRASGTDNTSNNYFSQLTQAGTSATDTNVIAGDAFTFGTTIANGDYNHGVYTISEPKRSQKTRLFGGGVALDNTTNSNLNSTAGSHFFNDTTSFDSFTIIANSGNITGRYAVYGLEK